MVSRKKSEYQTNKVSLLEIKAFSTIKMDELKRNIR